jgi:hypothetical protein
MLPFRQELGLASARPSSVTAPLARVASPYWVDPDGKISVSSSLKRITYSLFCRSRRRVPPDHSDAKHRQANQKYGARRQS